MLTQYPQTRLIRLDALSVFASWYLFYLSFLVLVAAYFDIVPYSVVVWVFGSCVLTAMIHVLLANMHRCPNCNKHPTIEGFRPVHPASEQQSNVSGWAGVIKNVMKNKKFVCIHCGQEFACDNPS